MSALSANSQSWTGNVRSVAVELKENTSTGCQLELLLPARTQFIITTAHRITTLFSLATQASHLFFFFF